MKYLISLPPNLVNNFHQIEKKDKKDWFVTADPKGQRIGSGGGTAHILTECWKNDDSGTFSDWLKKEKKIIIHAGGLSRRLPAYAPSGKILTPLPVFRWSRGQDIQQKLLDLQLPLFEKVINKASSGSHTLITAGDVLIWNNANLPEIPAADVVCLGIWTEQVKATNHGVFFLERNPSGDLAFMLQKPDTAKIMELSNRYDLLIDIGIWLLSDKAVKTLLKKCGWLKNENKYIASIPEYYDLYTDFGLSIGNQPSIKDDEINQLTVAIVALDNGEFYHFGKTGEVIESAANLQNRVLNQRVIWHRRVKPHSSIFVLNAFTEIQFTSENQNVWIENSHISKNWKLGKNQMITGIPVNNWDIQLKDNICLDIIPLYNGKWCIRPYGFNDPFKGEVWYRETIWMGRPVNEWFTNKSIKLNDIAQDGTDIQFARIFPVVEKEELTGELIHWMVDSKVTENKLLRDKYLKFNKISASEISDLADLVSLQKQRDNFLALTIPLIANNHEYSIFYQLDLEKLADDYVDLNIPLPSELGEEAPVMKRIHDLMFRAKVLELQKKDGQLPEQKAFVLLKDCIISSCFNKSAVPELTLLKDQIIWGRSPVRIDLAGGWTDTPPYCLLNGGKVVNMALNLNGQPPLQCFIKPSDVPRIIIRSIDLGVEEVISNYEQITNYNRVGSAFSITKAALSLVGFSPEFCTSTFKSLENQLEQFGGGLEITSLSAVPKGSGMGTSSILAATILGTLAETCNLQWDSSKISLMTLVLEQLLTTGGGWQDQFGGITQGVKLIETKAGFDQAPIIKWLPERLFCDIESKSCMLLYYTGITRVAKDILAEIVRGMFLNSAKRLRLLEEIGNHAITTFEVIQKGDYQQLGKQIEKSWELNNRLDAGTNSPEIQMIIDCIDPYLIGKKLAGAGGGGFLFMLAKDIEAAKKVKDILNSNPPNNKARFVDFQLSDTGLQITRS